MFKICKIVYKEYIQTDENWEKFIYIRLYFDNQEFTIAEIDYSKLFVSKNFYIVAGNKLRCIFPLKQKEIIIKGASVVAQIF